MIRSLFSDLETFKELHFRSGLNVLLAEKSHGATKRQTRNRAGKSSMVQMIHFLLGSRAGKGSLFRSKALQDHEFGMELDLAGKPVRVQRRGSKPSAVLVGGSFDEWPQKPRQGQDGRFRISNTNWQLVLGALMFGLDDEAEVWSPTFRSMISYFARRERDGGFHVPIKQNERQAPADHQVNLSYLLGLDWSISQELQKVRDREKGLKELKKGLEKGAFGDVIQKASSLKTQIVVAEDRVRRLRERIAGFKVVEEYHELEMEASRITRDLASLSDDNTLDRRYIGDLKQAMDEEIPPSPPDLQRVYKEVGIVLPELVQRRYDDLQNFHESVLANRKSYLTTEVTAAESRIAERGIVQQRLDTRRAELMQVLSASGALEHFSALQAEEASARAQLESLRQRHQAAEALETGTTRLKVLRAGLEERLREDYAEQHDVVDQAILTFQRISTDLYEDDAAGSLTLTPTDNGPEFEIEIQGKSSKGVSNMQIFCFDMMLTILSLERGRSPGFLVHDSHLFDGVDERQVGTALALGARLADEYGFQYIVTLNTDDIPSERPMGFEVEDYALDVRLSDSTEDGGLFGFRFD